MRKAQRQALHVYILLRFCAAFFFSLVFTASQLYYVTTAQLSPFRLVLTGTILESTVFLFEIPTGVVADTISRRLSIIVGYTLIGLGFLLEGAIPRFWTIALAQVIWGLAYTFTSGATEAWIADELGTALSGTAFVRGAQAASAGALAAIPMSIALGRDYVAWPIVFGGAGIILLAVMLACGMPERGFSPRETQRRRSWQDVSTTLGQVRQLAARQPLIWTILAIGFFYGLYSEGFDRLSVAHLLNELDQGLLGRLSPIVWFGVLRGVQHLLAMAAGEVARRGVLSGDQRRMTLALTASAAGIMLSLAGFALAPTVHLGLLLYLVIQTLRALNNPVHETWLNRQIDDSRVRATVFSASGQADAIGQIAGGPIAGWIGSAISVRAALLASACMLSPVLPLYGAARRRESSPGRH